MHNQASKHPCMRKRVNSTHYTSIHYSLMQTKVTAVSPPSLLFSLGQLIGRTKKRERKIHEKQQTLFSSLPGNSLKFFFIKEKIDIYIYIHVYTQCKEGWTNGNKSQIRQRSPGLLFHQFMSLCPKVPRILCIHPHTALMR